MTREGGTHAFSARKEETHWVGLTKEPWTIQSEQGSILPSAAAGRDHRVVPLKQDPAHPYSQTGDNLGPPPERRLN